MVTEVMMPKLGQTMEEGKIEKWLKKEGERVEKGDLLLEVTTDKATLEVEAYGSGILRKVLVESGETVPVTTVIGYIAEKDEELPEAKKTEEAKEEARTEEMPERKLVKEVKPADKERVKASPLARKIASEKGIELESVKGTGPGGRITKEDVLSAVSASLRAESMSPMRRAIARQMSASKREIPHYYLTSEIDMTEISKKRVKDSGISFTHIIIKAVATALSRFPQMNAIWEKDAPRKVSEINIGIAVGLEDGLIVPVLRDAGEKSVKDISREVEALVSRAKEKRLSIQEYSGGTFTISNLGMFGVENFIPIINLPEVAILGVGAIKERCVPVGGKVEIRPVMKVTVSADHRAVDGAYAAQFLKELVTILEKADIEV